MQTSVFVAKQGVDERLVATRQQAWQSGAAMSQHFDYDLPRVAAFMQRFLPGLRLAEGMVAIGLVRHARLVAGVVYEGLNRHNVWMHVAAEPGALGGEPWLLHGPGGGRTRLECHLRAVRP